MSEYQNFLDECKRYLKYVAITQDQSQSRLDVGLHGRKASWSLDFAKDALGVEQPVLVGKYIVKVKNEAIRDGNTTAKQDSDGADDCGDEDEEDSHAAPAPSNCLNGNSSYRSLNITVFITYNQPYGVPSLDFVACELETGRPVTDVEELRRDWLPNIVDAVAVSTEAAQAFEERTSNSRRPQDEEDDRNDEEHPQPPSVNSTIRNTILTPANVPQISRMVHETLDVPVFCVHACDTVSHFKMMKIAMLIERSGSRNERNEFSQSPIDVVLALYGKFIGLA